MNVFFIASIVAVASLLVGLFLAGLFVALSRTVTRNQAAIEIESRQRKSINPKATAGFALPATAAVDVQLKEARKLAAQAAARVPRFGNQGIGRLETTDAVANRKVASVGAQNDPLTAVKIAQFHTWNGLTYRPPTQAGAAPRAGGAAPAAPKTVKRTLVAGKDYPVTAVTAAMGGPERRAARIANAKAKAAALKALKSAGQDMVAAPVAEAVAAPAVAAAPAPALSANLPPAPELIAITDSMSPDEVRKARITNSKAKSAYAKLLKEMGIDPAMVGDGAEAAETPVAAPAVAAAAAAAPPAPTAPNLPPPPDLVEITDAMSPDEVRRARIENSRTLSAYKKELKALGIDPASLKL